MLKQKKNSIAIYLGSASIILLSTFLLTSVQSFASNANVKIKINLNAETREDSTVDLNVNVKISDCCKDASCACHGTTTTLGLVATATSITVSTVTNTTLTTLINLSTTTLTNASITSISTVPSLTSTETITTTLTSTTSTLTSTTTSTSTLTTTSLTTTSTLTSTTVTTTITTTTLTTSTLTTTTLTTTTTVTTSTTTTLTSTTTLQLGFLCGCYDLWYNGESLAFSGLAQVVDDNALVEQISGWSPEFIYSMTNSLRVSLQDTDNDNTTSGAYLFSNSGNDFTGYSYIQLKIRGGISGELTDNASLAFIDTDNNISSFVSMGVLTGAYKNVNLSLSSFTGSVDWSSIKGIVFQSTTQVSNGWSYLYIDDIETNCETNSEILYDGEIALFSGITIFDDGLSSITETNTEAHSSPNSLIVNLVNNDGDLSASALVSFASPINVLAYSSLSMDLSFESGSNVSIDTQLTDGSVTSSWVNLTNFISWSGWDTVSIDFSSFGVLNFSSITGIRFRITTQWATESFLIDNIRADCRS